MPRAPGASLRLALRLGTLAALTALAPVSAATAALTEQWSSSITSVVASGSLDGSPGVELLVTTSSELRILDPVTGTVAYTFDPSWSPSAAPVAWIGDVDQDGRDEIVVTLTSSPKVALFDWDGVDYKELWSMAGIAPIAVEFADVTGTGDAEVVMNVGPLWIAEAATGTLLYDSLVSIGGAALLAMEVADRNGDGRADVLAQFNVVPNLYLVSDSTPLPAAGAATRRPSGLLAARPNPWRAATTIPFSLAADGRARIRVFDVTGRLVRTLVDARLPRGSHAASWDGRDGTGHRVASGTYFYELTAGGRRAARKTIRLR